MKKMIWLVPALALFVLGCNDDDDGIIDLNTDDFPVQSFMWSSMNLWYFWQAEVPDLADDRFSTDQDFVQFAQSQSNEEAFLQNLLFSEDRFTFWDENYENLVNNLSGISRSNGLEFGLVQFSGSNDIFGYVRYVLPDSDASTKDISRGEIFTRVDGQRLNLNNYADLLFGNNNTYTLGMADITDGQITDNDKEVTLTKVEGFVENPILVAETLDVGGTKIAYLMYNRFLSSFNQQLNNAFAEFISEGATELVLDMRYNPGGNVNTSRLLASMVYGTNTSELYIRQRWNAKIQEQLSTAQLEDYFADSFKINEGTENEVTIPLNSLNLNRVYVLATNSSASASELVMNGLAPYVEVIHVGETTRGKNEFSITLVDDRQNSFIYNDERENQINPENSWAIQPLVGRNENADGFFDYTDGLPPNIVLEEDLENLGILGDPNEPLLARAIEAINSVSTRKATVDIRMPAKAFTGSNMETVLRDKMFLDKPLTLKLNE
nr:S41 family peptidase [Allomuricauda sp.]